MAPATRCLPPRTSAAIQYQGRAVRRLHPAGYPTIGCKDRNPELASLTNRAPYGKDFFGESELFKSGCERREEQKQPTVAPIAITSRFHPYPVTNYIQDVEVRRQTQPDQRFGLYVAPQPIRHLIQMARPTVVLRIAGVKTLLRNAVCAPKRDVSILAGQITPSIEPFESARKLRDWKDFSTELRIRISENFIFAVLFHPCSYQAIMRIGSCGHRLKHTVPRVRRIKTDGFFDLLDKDVEIAEFVICEHALRRIRLWCKSIQVHDTVRRRCPCADISFT